jgi:hypothetical protein
VAPDPGGRFLRSLGEGASEPFVFDTIGQPAVLGPRTAVAVPDEVAARS